VTPFLDTSVLLAGLVDFGPQSVAAQRILLAVAEDRLPGVTTAWHCCLEFYAVSTRLPAEFRLSPDDATRLLQQEILERVAVHDLPAVDRLRLLRQSAQDAASGGRIYDAHIAEVARAAGATVIVTDNRRHFVSALRHGIRVDTPSEFAASLRK
jgi:predicted nucleic acid-binding protein